MSRTAPAEPASTQAGACAAEAGDAADDPAAAQPSRAGDRNAYLT